LFVFLLKKKIAPSDEQKGQSQILQ